MLRKGNTRILRPFEFEQLLESIPKVDYKTMFEALLFSGMRYSEFKNLNNHPKLFNGRSIYVKSTKTKARQVDRYVKLNAYGKTAIRYFLQSDLTPPCQPNWIDDLNRWAKYAELETDEEGRYLMGCKTSRKTWESWLITTFPEKIFNICMSQGHTELTSLRHYANLDFTEHDKEDMKKYVEGWG